MSVDIDRESVCGHEIAVVVVCPRSVGHLPSSGANLESLYREVQLEFTPEI